jgi:hypothetical protein
LSAQGCEAVSHFLIDQFLQRETSEYLELKSLLAQVVTTGIRQAQRALEAVGLLAGCVQKNLGGQLHLNFIHLFRTLEQERQIRFPPRVETKGLPAGFGG